MTEINNVSSGIEVTVDENSLEGRFIQYMEDNSAAFTDLDQGTIDLVKYSFFAGASACFELVEATHPENPNASNIIASARQVTALREEMVEFLDGEDDEQADS